MTIYKTDFPEFVSGSKPAGESYDYKEQLATKNWAAGKINFHQRVGALGGLAGKYLWVADNNDTKILVGGWG